MQLFSNKKSLTLLGIYFVTMVCWIALAVTNTRHAAPDYWYQLFLAIIPLLGGIFGLHNSSKWGGLKSKIGQAMFFVSLGLITWGLGQCYWSYVTIRGYTEVPYPSWADVGYIISWPLWTIGIVILSLAAGAKFSIRRQSLLGVYGKIFTFSAAIIALSYYLLIVVARGGLKLSGETALRVFFDLAYPVGDVVILTIAAISFSFLFKYLGGRYRPAIMLILLGYALNYVTDFTFSYVTTANTYFNGHFVDAMFPTVMMVLSLGVSLLRPPQVPDEQ